MGAKRIVGFVAAVFFIAACALYIAGNATATWSVYTYSFLGSSITVNYGLWRYSACGSTCISYSYSCDSSSSLYSTSSTNCAILNVGRAFTTIACILAIFPGILLIIISAFQKYTRPLLWILRILALLTCFSGVIGIATGMAGTSLTGTSNLSAITSLSYTVGAGGGVAIVAVILSFIGLLLCACVRRDKSPSS